jgi:hypothetical protein
MGISYERLHWIDDAFYFRVHYAAQPFCRVADTGHEWEIRFARGPKHLGPYYATNFVQAKRWVTAFARHHEKKLTGQMMRVVSGEDPTEPWPWPHQSASGDSPPTKAIQLGQSQPFRLCINRVKNKGKGAQARRGDDRAPKLWRGGLPVKTGTNAYDTH